MDWSWMDLPRNIVEYYDGVDTFINFAYRNLSDDTLLRCPCCKCTCLKKWEKETVREHLYLDGVIKDKHFWKFYGEGASDEIPSNVDVGSPMHRMLADMIGMPMHDLMEDTESNKNKVPIDKDSKRFFDLLKDAKQPAYPGCKKFSKLSFLIRLINIKSMGGWSNRHFDMLLMLLKDFLPEGESLPSSFYETKKVLDKLGYGYRRIDACPNDCILYWKEYEDHQCCPKCGESRWKTNKFKNDEHDKTRVAQKVLRHFPIIPRLQRLFMCSKSSISMTWHESERQEDGILRHPADSACWKTLDDIGDFGLDCRNVRLGLASDGFNPFGNMNISHSTWPVLLVPYNLPPWECMKSPNILLSLLISGPKGPGNDIDIYLQPLIEELQILWNGVETFDAAKGETFCMRAALLWTINDFPAYAYMSGWSTKGRLACPKCNKDTCSKWLDASGKFCYIGHRKWLKFNHIFRRMSHQFYGNEEWGDRPMPLSGDEELKQLKGLSFKFGKKSLKIKGKRRRNANKVDINKYLGWKKHSIFFSLPYWKSLLLRHNLDVMHIEKNVCESLIGTLLSIDGKNKDGLKARQDLQNMGIRTSLHPRESDKKRIILPASNFTCSKNEKEKIFKMFQSVKVPDGYSSNIAKQFLNKDKRLWGLKSHDYHVIMQQLLPVAVRLLSQKEVCTVISDLCHFFMELCSKVASADKFYHLGNRAAIILCRLERIFPPSFFDIMIHLIIHLADDARVAGPVHYRWMYPIERYLVKLKSYVRNKACPEGSMAECYLVEETLTFAARYLDDDVETWLNKHPQQAECHPVVVEKGWDIFGQTCRPIGACIHTYMQPEDLHEAHRYVLFNCSALVPYVNDHLLEIRSEYPRLLEMEIQRLHTSEFARWLKIRVHKLQTELQGEIPSKLRWIKDGPINIVKKYEACIVNGFKFHTRKLECRRVTQNSGVVLSASTSSFSSSKDTKPIYGDVTYYGVLDEIIELDYYGEMRIVLFKCDWVDINRGVKQEGNLTLINPSCTLKTKECYVFASQVEQVWYIEDLQIVGWYVVRKTSPRDLFNMAADQSFNDGDFLDFEATHVGNNNDNDLDDTIVNWERDDIDGIEI